MVAYLCDKICRFFSSTSHIYGNSFIPNVNQRGWWAMVADMPIELGYLSVNERRMKKKRGKKGSKLSKQATVAYLLSRRTSRPEVENESIEIQ